MKNQYVEAIVIKGNKILIGEGSKNKSPIHFLLKGELREDENSIDAIKREINEQLNVTSSKVFGINRNIYSNTSTFLVKLEENIKVDAFDNVKIPNDILDFEGFKWISLYDKELFRPEDIISLQNLLDQLFEKDDENLLDENIRNAIEDLIFSCSPNRYITLRLLRKKHIYNMKKIDSKISLKEKTTLFFIALFLGLIFERFFVEKSLGISYTIFTLMFVSALLWSFHDKLKPQKTVGWFIVIPIMLLSLTFTIYSNPILKVFNVVLIPLLITTSAILIRYEDVKWDKVVFFKDLFSRMFSITIENIFKPFIFMKSIIKFNKTKEITPMKKDILKGILISIPILVIVLILLTSADMVFSYYLRNISKVFENINIGKSVGHILVIILVSLYTFAYLWSFKYPYDNVKLPSKKSNYFSIVTILTVIIAVNAVYLLFCIVQFSYLYGGSNNILSQGFTYAEYARKGFFELVFVALINFAIILYSLKFTEGNSRKIYDALNISLSLLIIFTFNMLFSAHYKLSLYENTYGFTYLRVFVHIFMMMLFILFIITLLGIWNKKINIIKACTITIVIMYIFINYINVDVLIAKKNIERYHNTGRIDVAYLTYLSYDAAPYIITLRNVNNEDVSQEITKYIYDKQKYFKDKKSSWTEFNYSEYKAKKVLSIYK